MKTIGYTSDSYPEKRTIIDGSKHPLKFLKSVNTERYQRGLRLSKILARHVDSVFYEWILPDKTIDGIHLFNSITRANVPWISTFETYIPRSTNINNFDITLDNPIKNVDKKLLSQYFEILIDNNCKKLIAMSDINLQMEKKLLSFFPEYQKKIEKKLIKIHPPQEKLMEKEEIINKEASNSLKFLFVGRDFVRKGGREILEVFEKIKTETNFDFELEIVSLGKHVNYAFGDFQDDEKEIEALIESSKKKSWVTIHDSLPHSEVVKLMKKADVGLLPTWADTYGYSVLEFQATGCPVVTTNIRALPEINSDDRGWLISLDVDMFNEIRIKTIDEKLKNRLLLQEQMEDIIINILNNPDSVKEKALNAYEYVDMNHSVSKYMEQLSEIYETVF